MPIVPSLISTWTRNSAGARNVVALLILCVASALLSAVPSSAAASNSLCSGYDDCTRRGYGDGGYRVNDRESFWGMYPGRNCTNYVAYRLVEGGLSNRRPWSSTGMAYNWGRANHSAMSQTPTAGAVAWWDRGVGGASSAGHLAYVEEVVSSTEIVVSESNWASDFSWRRLTKSGTGWPSGFLRFEDAGPTLRATAPPTISGAFRIGEPHLASSGTWSEQPRKVTYQWFSDGRRIPDANDAAFTPQLRQLGTQLTVEVHAVTPDGRTAVTESPSTSPLAKGTFAKEGSTSINGIVEPNEVLTVAPASVQPLADRTRTRWLVDGKRYLVGPSLELDETLTGHSVSVVTVARSPGYERLRSASPAVRIGGGPSHSRLR